MPSERPLDDQRIKILFLSANPGAMARMRLDREVRRIEEKLRAAKYRDAVAFTMCWAVRSHDLQRALLEVEPHIVHFSGHGSPSEEIILEADDGSPMPISKAALARLFGILRDNVRVVVLNACHSLAQAEAITEHVDCAIGMRKAVNDYAAIAFSAAFYQALAFGRTIQEAFDLGRSAVELEGVDGAHTAELLVRHGTEAGRVNLLGPIKKRSSPSQEPSYPNTADPLPVLSTIAESPEGTREGPAAPPASSHDERSATAAYVEKQRELLHVSATLARPDEPPATIFHHSDFSGFPDRCVEIAGYRLIDLLGRGERGEVWSAIHEASGAEVAVKFLHPGQHRRHEIHAMARITSPHVVKLLAVVQTRSGNLFIFEKLRGESLAVRLARERFLPLKHTYTVIDDVLQGLVDIHAAGVIHRDVQPNNIFLEPTQDANHRGDVRRERGMILGFGFSLIVRSRREDATVTASPYDWTRCSLTYLAPEQVSRRVGERVDERADIYSLGVVAFHALSGRLPYGGTRLVAIAKMLDGAASLADTTGRQWPIDLECFLKKALDRKRECRFQTAAEALACWRRIRQR